ncbi:TPA: DUF424 domain-containing protein [Candidatus Bathyarchaeota archaeon]|nr:DUF424 domain-containing protein [Candidatus Bathyarchaeota archaeon]
MNVFHRSEKKLVALCDVDVLGKTFKEGKLKLEVKEGFYRGTLTTMDKAMEELHEADIGNLVGRNVVGAAIERGLVNPKAVIYISGTPHVQILRL